MDLINSKTAQSEEHDESESIHDGKTHQSPISGITGFSAVKLKYNIVDSSSEDDFSLMIYSDSFEQTEIDTLTMKDLKVRRCSSLVKFCTNLIYILLFSALS